jgi:hypothetical protein
MHEQLSQHGVFTLNIDVSQMRVCVTITNTSDARSAQGAKLDAAAEARLQNVLKRLPSLAGAATRSCLGLSPAGFARAQATYVALDAAAEAKPQSV